MQRNKKAVSIIFLACGTVTGLLFAELLASLWVLAHLPQPADWIVVPSDAIAAVIGIGTFVLLIKNSKVVAFTNEVITELAKVIWPNPKETVLSTGVVSVLVGICAMILFGFDVVWGAVVRIFYQ
jgi:preprotein translocase SecE subunit